MQGKRDQDAVGVGHDLELPNDCQLRGDIRVTQRHTLGWAGRSRSVKEHRWVLRLHNRQLGRFLKAKLFPATLVVRRGVQENDPSLRVDFLDARPAPFGRDHRPRFAVRQNVGQVVVAKLNIERDHHRAGPDHAERGRDPFGTVFGEKHNAIAAPHARPNETIRELTRTLCELRERPAPLIVFGQRQERCLFGVIA
jgi:hypothetical protein